MISLDGVEALGVVPRKRPAGWESLLHNEAVIKGHKARIKIDVVPEDVC
jgi:hypothetical protein